MNLTSEDTPNVLNCHESDDITLESLHSERLSAVEGACNYCLGRKFLDSLIDDDLKRRNEDLEDVSEGAKAELQVVSLCARYS
jgi:hypothetical protein